jgi:hypothetical protein
MIDPTPGTTTDGREPLATPGTVAGGSTVTDQERQELESLRAGKQQWLGEKTKYEQTQAELDEERRLRLEAQSQPPASAVDPITADVQGEYMNLLMQAAAGNPQARFQLAVLQGQQQEMARIRRDALISSLPGDERSEVETLLRSNPNLDVPTARTIVQGNQASKRLKDMEARDAEAKRIAEEMGRAGNLGTASVRTAPATPTNGTMKASDFNSRLAALNQRIADGDRGARQEALNLGRQVDTGAITLIYD